jgi:hypothetical protein
MMPTRAQALSAGNELPDANGKPITQATANTSESLPVPAPSRKAIEPSFAALISSINMTGWVPTKTRLYCVGSPPPVSSEIDVLPFSQYDDQDPQKVAILQEFQCRYVVKRDYQRGQRRIVVQAYRFDGADGAYGSYNLLRHGASTVVTRGDASSEDDQSISFWKDKEFVLVYGTSEDDEESKEAVRSIADQIGRAIVGHAELPAMIGRLPAIDRVRGTEKLVMGPASARRFFPAPYIASLSMEKARTGAVADYQIQSPYPERLKLLCVQYADSAAATRAYDSYTANLQDAKRVDEDGAQAGSLFKIGRGYLLCQVHGEELVIVSGARRKFSPVTLARQVY